jgi:hypothetical protein
MSQRIEMYNKPNVVGGVMNPLPSLFLYWIGQDKALLL